MDKILKYVFPFFSLYLCHICVPLTLYCHVESVSVCVYVRATYVWSNLWCLPLGFAVYIYLGYDREISFLLAFFFLCDTYIGQVTSIFTTKVEKKIKKNQSLNASDRHRLKILVYWPWGGRNTQVVSCHAAVDLGFRCWSLCLVYLSIGVYIFYL